ncbi:MAG: diaminopimelate decarboxylase family protein [Candidatus Heimdallarchaeota archaeon]
MSEKLPLLNIKENTLHFDGVNLVQNIAAKYGTPTYIFSENAIKQNLHDMQTAFTSQYPQTEIAYSTKNNMIFDISSIIAEELNFFETTSLAELILIEKLSQQNNKPLNLISTNLYKPDGLIAQIINFGSQSTLDVKKNKMSGIIAIDSYQDMKNVERIAKKLNKKAKVLVRVNPGIQMSREKTIFASAYPDAKCSTIIKDIQPIIDLSQNESIDEWLLKRTHSPKYDFAERIIQEAEESKHLDLLGIHGHLGSQVTNIDYFHHFFEVITLFYKLMEEKLGRNFTYLDLGGGYPVQYSKTEQVPSIEEIAVSLSQYISRAKIAPRLIIESGRYITASSGLLLSQVNLTKENPSGGKIAVLDMSAYGDLLDVIAAKWHFDISLVNDLPVGTDPANKFDWDLVGSTNDTLDQLNPINNSDNSDNIPRSFPRDLEPNDFVVIKNAGAYTTCFNSNYCGRPKPMIVLIEKDKNIRLINRNYW